MKIKIYVKHRIKNEVCGTKATNYILSRSWIKDAEEIYQFSFLTGAC